MMADGFIHTVHKDGEWVNEIEDSAVASAFETKAEAIEAGRKEAQSRLTEHVIHNEDGTVSGRNSYGNDPSSRPG
jgi:hypothetical protein